MSWSDFQQLQAENSSVVELAAASSGQLDRWHHPGGDRLVDVLHATPSLFRVLGARPILGRAFTGSASAGVALVGEPFWQQWLGGDPAVIGRTLPLRDSGAVTIVGVLPAGFRLGRADPQVVVATGPAARGVPPDAPALSMVVGRLRPGVRISMAKAAIDATDGSLANQQTGKDHSTRLPSPH